jgi:hypothetical protein
MTVLRQGWCHQRYALSVAQLDELPPERCILQDEWPPGEASLDEHRQRLSGGAEQAGDGQSGRAVRSSVAMNEHAPARPRASRLLAHKQHRFRQVQAKQVVARDVLAPIEGAVRDAALHVHQSAVMGSGRSTVQDCRHAKLHQPVDGKRVLCCAAQHVWSKHCRLRVLHRVPGRRDHHRQVLARGI